MANELREQPRRLAEASARSMHEADVAMEGVMPEIDRAYRRGPPAMRGGLRHQGDTHPVGQPYEAPASMTLTPRPGLDPEQTALVTRHLKHLAISARYHHFFKDEYLRLLRLVRTIRQKGMDVVANLELFRENALNKSINSWGHVFYDGVLADPGLIDCKGNEASCLYERDHCVQGPALLGYMVAT